MNKTTNTQTFITIALAIVILSGLGAYYLSVRESADTTETQNLTQTPSPSPTITATDSDEDIQTDLDATDTTNDDSDLKVIENDINQL